MPSDDSPNKGRQCGDEERLAAIFKGAFSGPPTLLKDIPKREGGKRAGAHKASPRKLTKPTR